MSVVGAHIKTVSMLIVNTLTIFGLLPACISAAIVLSYHFDGILLVWHSVIAFQRYICLFPCCIYALKNAFANRFSCVKLNSLTDSHPAFQPSRQPLPEGQRGNILPEGLSLLPLSSPKVHKNYPVGAGFLDAGSKNRGKKKKGRL